MPDQFWWSIRRYLQETDACRHCVFFISAVLILAACTSSQSGIVPDDLVEVSNLTPSFLIVEDRALSTVPADPSACLNPLIHPDDGSRWTLVRSESDRAYYRPSQAGYGMGASDVLLVVCSTRRVIGIVRDK